MMNLINCQGHPSLLTYAAVRGCIIFLATAALAGVCLAQNASPQQTSFPIYEFQVKGNSVLTQLAIEKVVSPFTGEKKTIEDVEAARLALEKTYHDAGFMSVLVTIPEQNVDTAMVELQVVEANVDRLIIKGAEYTAPSIIRSRLTELTGDKPPNFNAMQDQLAGLNRSNDMKVTPILKQGRLPGTIDVQLDVDDQSSFHGNVEANNRRNSASTSDLHTSVGMRYDNLFQLGHSAGLTLITVPKNPEESTVWVANYAMPLSSLGSNLSLFVVKSKSNIISGNTLIDGRTYGARVSRGLKGLDNYSHNVSAGLDYKKLRVFTVEDKSPPEYVPLIVNYGATLLGTGRTTGLDVTLTNGLRGTLTDAELNFNERGRGASANFTTLKTGLLHTETLKSWTLVAKLNAMLSSGILLSSEQMSMGGADSVRGYLEGERTGDRGYQAGLELLAPALKLGSGIREWNIRGLGFVEGGRLYTLSRPETIQYPATTAASSARLGSVGMGLRVQAPQSFVVDADLARTLIQGDSTQSGKSRLTLRAVWSY